jgi:hypothetical protein
MPDKSDRWSDNSRSRLAAAPPRLARAHDAVSRHGAARRAVARELYSGAGGARAAGLHAHASGDTARVTLLRG